MQLNPKARAVNKAQRQLRPESYFLEFFKSPAQGRRIKENENVDNSRIYNCTNMKNPRNKIHD